LEKWEHETFSVIKANVPLPGMARWINKITQLLQ